MPRRRSPSSPSRPETEGASVSAGPKSSPADLITILEDIARDVDAPGATRTAAARAVLEARGELGKHQRAPGDGTAIKPLSEATRPELESELARLRLHFAAHALAKT